MPATQLPKKTKLFFNDGFVFDREKVIFASQPEDYAAEGVSRVSQVKNFLPSPASSAWEYYDVVNDTIVSVTGYKTDGAKISFFLGAEGLLVTMGGGRVTKQKISDTARYGKLLRIRAVADVVFACGMSGQLLSNAGGSWHDIAGSVLGGDGLDFEDIDGSDSGDVYAVGVGGNIFHYDGRQWSQLESPTNRPLSNVRCRSRNEVFICGNDGTLLCGNARDGWRDLSHPSIPSNFWGMAIVGELVYLAYSAGVLAYGPSGFVPVEGGLPQASDFHRLDAADGLLWSIGIHHICFLHDGAWTEVVCPMNV